jgi:DNA-binding CsgD family transcriptional regulator
VNPVNLDGWTEAHGDELAAAGLSDAEEAAYEQIIARPGATLAELAGGWARPERLTAVLAGLRDKGFLTNNDSAPPRYTAIDPSVALEAPLLDFEERLRQAQQRARELGERHRAQSRPAATSSVAELVCGRQAVRQQFAQIQRAARNELCCLDKPLGGDSADGADPTLLRPSVLVRTIYEPASVEHVTETPSPWIIAGQVRILPALPMRLYLADRRYAMLPLPTPATGCSDATEAAVLVHQSALLDALATLFDGLWRRALPLSGPHLQAPAQPHPKATVDQQRLLTLLLSGLTDTAIARQLGIAHRTVQRHVTSLMYSLGAHSRFQIGIQAAIRDRQA